MICDHWREHPVVNNGGDCAAGKYKVPSFGVCLRICPHRVVKGEPQQPQPTLKHDEVIAQVVADAEQETEWVRRVPLTFTRPLTQRKVDLATFFDRIMVVSLRRTPERLEQFRAAPSPVPAPVVFPGIDGDILPSPHWFSRGGGAWGCWRSHYTIIEQALNDGVKWLLLMEDDCAFVKDAAEKLRAFLSTVPDDAHCLMIGGQQHDDGQSIPIGPGVRKVSQCERTHCFALSRAGMESLYRWWSYPNDAHCDWQLGDWQESPSVNCYRPDPFIAYQASNFSTLCWRYEPARAWDGAVPMASRNPATIPVVILQCTRETLDLMRRRGVVHSGFWRDEEDIDKGLVQALKGDDPAKEIAELVKVLRGEVAGFDRAIVALWHPRLRLNYPGAETIAADSADDGEFKIKMYLRRLAGWNVGRPEVFYHIACMGNWRDVLIEQLDLAASCGLAGPFHVSIAGGSGADAIWAVASAAERGIAFDIVHRGKLDEYEIPALRAAWEWARANVGAVLYWHTKGVSKPGDRNKLLWRRLMGAELIAKWKENLKLLAEFDAVGVDWQDSPQHPHFSGNFWLARSDWIAGLCDPLWFKQSRAGTMLINHPWERMSAEMWLGTRQYHHIKSLVCRNENLWSGDGILKFIAPPAGECDRCGSRAHAIEDCPFPPDSTPEKERMLLLANICCSPPQAV
jgi:hypothetical protein